jgi:hypothetical protein
MGEQEMYRRIASICFLIALAIVALSISAQQPQCPTCPIYAVNAKYVNGAAPGYAPTAGSGLTLNISAGRVRCTNTMTNYAGGTLTMTNSTANYVYLDTGSSCAPGSNTTGYTSTLIQIATVITSGGVITTITDDRTFGLATPAGGGITSINASTGPGVTIQGVGSTGVSASGNTISISGSTTGSISGTWYNQSGNYTIQDIDNTNRIRFTTGGAAITLPQPGTIASSPIVGLKFNVSFPGTTTTYTSSAYTQTSGNQMYVALTEGENNPLTGVPTDSRGDNFVLLTSSNGTNERTEIYYCANLLSSGSTTMTVNFTGGVAATSGLVVVELTGTTHDNSKSATSNGISSVSVTNPIHFPQAMALAGGRTNAPTPSFFNELDTFSNGNVGTLYYRFLANQSAISTNMSGNNTILYQSILSILGTPTFVSGWQVEVEDASTGIQTFTSTSSTINGQPTLVLVPNEVCTLLSNGANWDATCKFTPNVQTNGVQGGPIEVAGVNTAAAGADQSTATLITTGAADAFYEVKASIACHTSTSTGTSTLTITYTDTSNTVQTATGTAACTTLGSASVAQVNPIFRAKASTVIQYGFAHGGTQPTVDVSVGVYQLSTK